MSDKLRCEEIFYFQVTLNVRQYFSQLFYTEISLKCSLLEKAALNEHHMTNRVMQLLS